MPFLGAALALALVACEKPHFTEAMTFAGQEVSAAELEEGRLAYTHYCRSCHGDNGDGKGPAALGLRPPPRDFKKGTFKFGSVECDQLPPDEDFVRIVTKGLHGTAMLEWDIPEQELRATIQYIKTFSPKWQKKKKLGEPIQPSADPFGDARRDEAVAKGKEIYHAKAQCGACHPSYIGREELYNLTKTETEPGKTELRDNGYLPGDPVKSLDYGGRGIAVPDFTFRPLRSVHDKTRRADLYRVVAKGVCGVMPKFPLNEEERWSLVYYLESLMNMYGTTGALALKDKLNSQPAFTPPPPPVPAPPPEAAPAGTTAPPAAAPAPAAKEFAPVEQPAKMPK
jgi:mono/diheme cytochrome c family protein